MQAKKSKLEQQSPSSDADSRIFKGISVFVNGYTSKYYMLMKLVEVTDIFRW